MSTVSVYSFADVTGLTTYVDSVGDFLLAGPWSSSGTYAASPLMAVQYGSALYMCIRDNVGDNPLRAPTRSRPTSWSILSLLYEYQAGGTNSPFDQIAMDAWELAQTGTNIAWAAYELALAGSNTAWMAHIEAGTKVDLSGGTMTGNLVVPNIQTGVGTHALAVASGGTVFYSFYAESYQRTKVDRNIYVNLLDMAPGRSIALVFEATGSPCTIGWPGQINFFGTPAPTSIQFNHVIVTMTSLNTTLDSIVAASSTSSGSGAIG